MISEAELLEDVSWDMEIKSVKKRAFAFGDDGAKWVSGTMSGYEFSALVFPMPAENRAWEVGGTSRISKLEIKKIGAGWDESTYRWDRGLDRAPTDKVTAAIVGFLCEGLAEHIFGV